jgi:hypothetical protein
VRCTLAAIAARARRNAARSGVKSGRFMSYCTHHDDTCAFLAAIFSYISDTIALVARMEDKLYTTRQEEASGDGLLVWPSRVPTVKNVRPGNRGG